METEPLSVLLLMPFLSIDVGIVIQFAVFILLLFCSAVISGAEVALFSLTPAEIETLKEEKTPTGNIIAKLAENPKKLLATVLIANNLVNISIVLLFVDLGDFLFGGITTSNSRCGRSYLCAFALR